MNLACNLENSAARFPDNPVVIEGDLRWSYGELERAASSAAGGLAKLGVEPGDHVALAAANSAMWLAVYFGVLKLGAVAVTLSFQLSDQEFDLLLGHSKPKVIFCDPDRLAGLEKFKNQGWLKSVVCTGGDVEPEDLLAGRDRHPARQQDPHDIACVLYTGGTTGIPKGVMLSHENINTSVNLVALHERSGPGDRALCFLPFNHVFGQMHIMNATILSGGGMVLQPGFDLKAALRAIDQHQVTKLFAVPTIYVRLAQVKGIGDRLKGVRYCFSAAAVMAAELVERWKKLTGLDIHEAYGMTESASLVTYNHYHQHKIGSVGTPPPTVEVSIRDEQGRRVPGGQEGEICIRGRNIMAGYLANPQATREAFRHGWFCSGDVGYLDEQGYLFIVDRINDLIISGGENVYPREVEEALHRLDAVAECAVIGLPDAEYGERVAAFLLLQPGAAIDPGAVKAFLKERLSPFKVPKEFVVVQDLPHSTAGKILKRELKKQVLAGEMPGTSGSG